jgi:hypothetical protein
MLAPGTYNQITLAYILMEKALTNLNKLTETYKERNSFFNED